VLLLTLILFFAGYEPIVRQGVLIAGAGWIGYQLNDLLRAVFQLRFAKHLGAIAETAGALVALLLVIVLAQQNAGPLSMLAATAAGFICTAALSWGYARRLLPFRPRVDWSVWRSLIIAGLPVAGSVILLNIQLRVDVLLLSIYHGARQVGLYDAPVKLYELLFVIPYLFGGLMMPLFVRDIGESRPTFAPRLTATIGASVMISGLVFAVLFVHAEAIVNVLAGPEFADSAVPLRILAAAAVFAGISAILRFAATALNKAGSMLRVDIVGVSAAVIAHLILIPRYGILGAALGKLCGDFVTAAAAVVMMRRQFTARMFTAALLTIAAATVLGHALSFASDAGIHWIVSIVVCGAAIGGALLLVPQVRRDLRLLTA
jgi:O-antigen/teichoic acid export membrane protein